MIAIRRDEVEATKLAVNRLDFHNLYPSKTLIRSIEYLLEQNSVSGDKGYLEAGLSRLQAFLELGFCYDDGESVFSELLSRLGTDKKEQFPLRAYNARKIPLTRAQISGVIDRWSPSKYHTMSKTALVEDIFQKASEKQLGVYEYHSNANPKGRAIDRVYILYVEEEASYLYNDSLERYYIFENT